jgi:hypothetical protein
MIPTSLTILAERIARAWARVAGVKEQWVEGTLELAVAITDARDRFPSDRQFAQWLAENELDNFSRDDRAALIQMARHLDVARIVLQETQRTSYQWIWREEIEPRCRHVTKPEAATAEPAPRRKAREPEPQTAASIEAAVGVIAALNAVVKSFDGIDLAAFRRGLTVSQRKHVEALKRQVRNWLDVLDISK